MNEKVIIIGGGIVGASAAYFLAKQDVAVTLIDRFDRGQATDAAAGIICPWISQRRNKAWYRLVKAGASMYPQLIENLEADGEKDTGYRRVGALSIHTDKKKLEATVERALKRREDAPEIGDIEYLDEKAAREKFPLLREGFEAVYVSGAARVDGRKVRDAMIKGAMKHGAYLIKGSAGLIIENDRVVGAYVNGEKIYADYVIAAAGAWMNGLLEPFGIDEIQVRPQKAQILHVRYDQLETDRLPVIMPPNDQYMLSFDDHRFVIGATHEDDMGYDTEVTVFGVHDILTKALDVAPALAESVILEARVGFRPMTEGSLPIIGSLESLDNLLYANGLGATGLTAGPLIGQQLAKLVLQEPTDINLEDYRL